MLLPEDASHQPMQRVFIRLLSTALTVTIMVTAVAAFALAGTTRMRSGGWRIPNKGDLRRLVDKVAGDARPSKIIYLRRESLQVTGGRDNARASRTSLLRKGETRTVPRYKASGATWRRLVSCVEDRFSAYDVVVTDKRPTSEEYILVKVGGRPTNMGLDKKLGGVAPFHGGPLPNSIVFVFDQRGRYRTKNNCETVAHEVGHVYGLDHTLRCKDLMSYKHDCGKKVFVDAKMLCGEKGRRPCEGAGDRQNSAQRLLSILGPRRNRS